MNSERGPFSEAPGTSRLPEVPGTSGLASDAALDGSAPDELAPGVTSAGGLAPAATSPGTPGAGPLPVMPGFREMALRRADEQAARMAEQRGRLVRELAEQRQAAGLSQTEVAARMGTSQSAVARLESGTADVRASTLERYAAAVGGQITWKLDRPAEGASE
ncbi:MAG TPA: helix-turn-helix transcriptional regulator [Streptosporangiaceae bacterium]|nr:helix-turn-helix transcriptional regulator [Streptosporangiaceae bacterium]